MALVLSSHSPLSGCSTPFAGHSASENANERISEQVAENDNRS
jgi:hypothetical protein